MWQIYLTWYLYACAGLYLFTLPMMYLDSFLEPKYRHLRIGDLLLAFAGCVIPLINFGTLYHGLTIFFEHKCLDRLMNITVFGWTGKEDDGGWY